VVDASSPRAEQQLESVERLLTELDLSCIPRVTVFNKMDRLRDPAQAVFMAHRYGGLAISARDPDTLHHLTSLLEDWIWRPDRGTTISLEELQ